jgi:hypothetical protein
LVCTSLFLNKTTFLLYPSLILVLCLYQLRHANHRGNSMKSINLFNHDIVTQTLSCVVYVAIKDYSPMFKNNPLLSRVISDCIDVKFVKTEEAVLALSNEFTSRVCSLDVVEKFYKALAPYRAEGDRQALKLYARRGAELGIDLLNISKWAVRFMVVNFLQDHAERVVQTTFDIAKEEIDHIIEHSDDFERFVLRFTDELEAGLRHCEYPE